MRTEIRRRRLARSLAIAGATALAALTLFSVGGFFVAPLVLRPVAEHRLGRWLGRKVTIDRIHVNPFALSVSVDRLKVLEADGRAPFVSVRRLYVNAELISVFRRAVVLREIRLESPRVRIERRQAPAGASTEAAVYNFSDIVTRLAAPAKTPAAPPTGGRALPRFSLNNIRVLDGELVFDDLPLAGHHEITGFTLGVPFLSTLLVDVDTFVAPGMSGRVDGTPFALTGRSKLFKDTIETVVALRLDALDVTRYLAYAPVPLPVTVSSALLTVALDISFLRPRDAAPRLSIAGKVLLENVSLREREAEAGKGPLLDLRRLGVTVANADISARRFTIDQVSVSGLDAHVRRLPGGKLNLQRLLPETASGAAAASATPPAVSNPEDETRFEVAEIRVEQAALRFRDETMRPPFEASVDDISVSVEHLSNAPGVQATVAAALRASPGGRLAGRGRFSLAPPASSGEISLDGFEPASFAPYYRDQVAFEVAKGRLDLGARCELIEKRNHVALRVRDGFVEAQDLALRQPRTRDEIVRAPRLTVRGVDADLDGRAIAIAEVSTRDGRLRIARDERGIVDVAALFRRAPSVVSDKAPDPPWAVDVSRLEMGGWAVRFDDRAVNPPTVVSLAPLSLSATSLSTAPGRRGNVDLRLGLNKRGRLALAGPISLDPPTADLRAELRAVDIVPLQSYVRELFDLYLTSGLVSFKGRARVGLPAPRIRLTGDVDIDDFAAIDRAKKEDLLSWRSFHLGGLDLSTAPVSVALREAALTDFDVRLIVFPDGHFNFESASDKPLRLPEKISVGQVKLARGKVVFTDRLIRPNPSTALTELAASVAGLSSDAGTRAEVDVRGRLDRSGLLTVAGKINPLAKDLFVDMRGDVKDFDLTAASPYAATYLAYPIKQGKLSLAVEYHVAQRKLAAHNRVIVDQLTFGDKVRSADAVNVPVRLAVSLLKDRRGVIDVELPVSGSLDDADFNVWRAMQMELRDRVVEAATAPFSYIAKAFGGNDELAYVTFPAGLARLDDKGRNKLATLAKALHERPQLSFEIQGGTDPQRDREGLRRDLFERKLRAQKRAELGRTGAAVGGVDDVRFDASERPRLLAAAYKADSFAKPRNVFGFTKSFPPEEMERLMLANIRVEDEELRALARRRAAVVKAALGELAPADAARLFLVNPRMDRGPSVDFRLKSD